MRRIILALTLVYLFTSHALAQSPQLLLDNGRLRVLRTVLEPHIKAPMHSHPAYVVVYLTNLHTKMEFPDGTVNDNRRKKGDVAWRDALKHSTENVEDQHTEEIQVEMK